ncbi:unnamed protein product [Moneuplotes crassus]|uniref:Uncharacterized protein n=1 Tax=Euplotes crassus TaxID=5936 RepID=A0AAD1X855_EUPCR|nr:unnamed protein product [Moneuplotes crassus]
MESVSRNEQLEAQRNQCEHEGCQNERKMFCKDHNSALCRYHLQLYHFGCCYFIDMSPEEIMQSFQPLKTILTKLVQFFNGNQSLKKLIPKYESIIGEHKATLNSIQKRLDDCVQNSKRDDFPEIYSDINRLQETIMKSSLYSSYKDLVFKKYMESGVFIAEQAKVKELASQDLEQTETVKQHSDEKLEFRAYKSQVESLEELKSEDTSKAMEKLVKLEQIENQVQKKEDEIRELQAAKEDLDREYLEEVCNITTEDSISKSKLASFIYKSIFGVSMEFNEHTILHLNMKDEKNRNFMEMISKCRIRLPSIKKVDIQYPSSFDSILRDFMMYSFPISCRLFLFNLSYDGWPKMSYYRAAFKDCLPRVSKEIYFYYVDASQRDFEEILSSSCIAERLVVYWSKVDTSGKLKLKIPSECNLEYISLQYTGLSGYSEWRTYKNRIENIISAIKDTQLSDSLRTLNVYNCDLTASDIQKIASTYSLPYLSIVDHTNDTPLND